VPLRCQSLHTVTSSLARVVSKPTHGLTNLNQVHICTSSLNLTGVMESESIASQAFPACYLAKGYLSDCYNLASRCYDSPWTGLLTSGDSGCHSWTAVGVRVTPLGRCNINRMTWEWSCQIHDMDIRYLDTRHMTPDGHGVVQLTLVTGIKPTVPLSAIDKENSLESSFHWSVYLYTIHLVCALIIPHSQPNYV